jgi:hypothetical protein
MSVLDTAFINRFSNNEQRTTIVEQRITYINGIKIEFYFK